MAATILYYRKSQVAIICLPEAVRRIIVMNHRHESSSYWFFDMENFVNAIAHEVKLEIANRYFGFRTRIESEKHDYLERLHNADRVFISAIRQDIRRMHFLLHREQLFKDFLMLAGLPKDFSDDASDRQLSSDPVELFIELKGEGFTRWRRFRDLAHKVYQSLADTLAAYRETYLDLSEEHKEICTRINDFHRNNDLSGILCFLRNFDSADIERLKFLHVDSSPCPGVGLDQDLRIALPSPVDALLPMFPAVPPLKQVKKTMTALLQSAFVHHSNSPRKTLPF